MNNTPDTPQVGESWDTYWQGTGDIGAFTNGGVSHPAIRAFWIEFFNRMKQSSINPRILDVASGSGAVIECALEAFNEVPSDLTSVDVSAAAIANIHERFPTVKGIVCDARSISAESGSFDIVTSQYGIEYAGKDAIVEAARLVADNGLLVLMMHCESGFIHQECQQSLDAIVRAQESKFVPIAIEMFEAGFKAIQGADRQAYDEAAKKLAPAITEFESIMRQHGTDVAGNTISSLYNDVGQIHQRMQHYEPNDVLAWLNRMNEELSAYEKRMSAMNASAISNEAFEQIKVTLTEIGFSMETADKLYAPDNEMPMAWVLVAQK